MNSPWTCTNLYPHTHVHKQYISISNNTRTVQDRDDNAMDQKMKTSDIDLDFKKCPRCGNKLWSILAKEHRPHKDAVRLAGDKDGLHGYGSDVGGRGAPSGAHGDAHGDAPRGALGDDPGEAVGDAAYGGGQHWGEEGDQQPEGGHQGRTR